MDQISNIAVNVIGIGKAEVLLLPGLVIDVHELFGIMLSPQTFSPNLNHSCTFYC